MRDKGSSLPFAGVLALATLLTPVPGTPADPQVGAAELATTTVATPVAGKPSVAAAYGKLPLGFEINRGQTDPAVQFLARGPGYMVQLTPAAVLLSINAPPRPPGSLDVSRDSPPATMRIQLIGARSAPRIVGADPLPGRSHYFIGNDPKKWQTDIPHYAQVRYQETYPGIDLVFYGNQEGRLEHDFVVRPGADPRAIQLGFEGVGRLELDRRGDLVLSLTAAGPPSARDGGGPTLRLEKPRLFQETKGRRQEIPGRYVLRGPSTARRVGFDVGPYDRTRPLVIDPVLRYSTYLGGLPGVNAIAVDADGNAYVTGMTDAGCATNGYEPPCYVPAFVNKLSPDGTTLLYSAYIGGSIGGTAGGGIAVDAQGNAYVTGTTESPNFPVTPGAVDPVCDCLWLDFENWIYSTIPDAFVAKLDPTGSTLVYATYLGGNGGGEHGRAIAIDGAGNAFVTGDTESTDFPTANPLQSSAGCGDAFVAALNSTGTALLYSTYLGGTADDRGFGIALDAAGNAYVTGHTTSTDFPIVNPVPGAPGGGGAVHGEAFVTKLDATGSDLVYSSYLGGSGDDAALAVAVDGPGNVYVTGRTTSTDFPTVAAYQAMNAGGVWDAFVTRVNAAGSALEYSTYLGGSRSDHGYGIAVDASGNAYVTGATDSADFPLASPLQAAFTGNYNVADAFVTRLDATGSGLVYSTYLGGASDDGGAAVALDALGNLYVAGSAFSSDFPVVPGVYSASRSWWPGSVEGFVAKIDSGAGVGIAVGPAVLNFGEQNVGTTSARRTATLTAAGSDPLVIGFIDYPYCPPEGGACDAGYWEGHTISVSGDFGLEIPCPYDVYPGTTCPLGVTFTPTVAGTRTGTITIEDNAPGSPHLIALTGTGVRRASQLVLSRTNLTFGNQPLGTTSAAQTATLTNIGGVDLWISSFVVSGDFAQTNSCGSVVAAGTSCTISVTFTPNAIGHVNGTVTIVDNPALIPVRLYLEGVGSGAAPAVALSPGSVTFASRRVGTTSAPQSVTLGNTGTAALAIAGILATGDFAQTNNCGGGVAAGASCVVHVTFAPTAEGTRTGTVTITDNATGSPHVVVLNGQGTVPIVVLSPASAAFGSQRVGTTTAAQTITLSNTGSAPLTVASIVASGDFAQINTCGGSGGTGATCVVSVTFTPTATGTRTGAVTITHDAAGGPHVVSLSGTGTAPSIALNPLSLSFASQPVGTTSAPQTVTLSNSGGAPLAVASIVASGNFAQTNTCGGSVGVGATCIVSITFTPTATGTRTGAVTITDDAAGSPHVVSLSGTGTEPSVALDPASLSFASQWVGTTSAPQTVTLSNTGGASLTVASIVASGSFAQTNTCGGSVGAGATCTLSITFAPTATGTRTGALTITHDAPGSPHVVSLSGTGTAPAVSLSRTTLTFAKQKVGTTSVAQTVTLNNTGSAPLAISSIVASGDFLQTNNCGSGLATGAACSISVRFRPTATGTRTGAITITDDASGSPHKVTLSGTGRAY